MNKGGVQYYELDEDGDRDFVTEERIQDKKDRLKNYIEDHC